MKTLPLNFPQNLSRGRLLTPIFFVFAVAIAYVLAGYIISGDLTSLAYSAMIFAGAVAAVTILRSWRNGAYFLLVWLLIEDFARKFLGNNMATYFAKDALVLLVYLSMFLAWRKKDPRVAVFRPPFLAALLLLVWFGAMQVFNTASTSIFFGLMGMKLYFYYVPLMILGYALIDSETSLQRFFYVNLSVMSVIALLGIVQSVIGPRFLNPAVIPEDIRLLSETYRVAPISGAMIYRPTSIFVSTGRFANMLVINWLLVFGFSGYLLLRRRRGRAFCFVALAVAAAGCLMCGSRGVFMWSLGGTVLGTCAFLWGAPWRQGEALRIIRTVQRALLGISLAVVVLLFIYPEPFLNRIAVLSETLDPRSPTSELLHRAQDYPLVNFLSAFNYDRWPYGYGIGTASLGGQYVMRFFHVRPPETSVESGYGCIILEMGIVGLCLWIVMSVSVVLSGWKVVRGLKGSPFFPLSFMLCLYSFILLVPMTFTGIQSYQDFVMNAYLWVLLGILFRLPKLAQAVQLAQSASVGGSGKVS